MDNQPGATRTMLTRGKSGRATRVRTGRTDSRKPGRAARDLGTDDIAIEEALSLFCASHSNWGTARSYRAALTSFTGFCSSRGVASLGDVSPPLLTAYPSSLVGRAAATRWHRLVVLRAFLRWASRAGWCGAASAEVILRGPQKSVHITWTGYRGPHTGIVTQSWTVRQTFDASNCASLA